MTSMELIFLPPEEQKLALQRNLGDAISVIAKHLFPHHTAKALQQSFDLDACSAKNVARGVAGGALVTRMLHTQQRKHGNAWALWLALGQLLIGEELDEFEQREVLRLIEQTENAKSLTDERRRRREALAASSRDAISSEPRTFAERPRRSSR